MSDERLKLEIGERLQLQRMIPEGGEQRFLVSVIGCLPGRSLLVTAPMLNDKVQFVRDGTRFAVRMLDGSHARGFVTVALHMASRPYPYLHLSYPDEIESIAVRNAERIDITLPALVRNTRDPDEQRHWHPVMIRDISLSGARLESVAPLGNDGEQLELRFRTTICGNDESLGLLGAIRNISQRELAVGESGGRYLCGIAFSMINRFQQVLLSNYVLEHRLHRQ